MTAASPLLEVRNLKVEFKTDGGVFRAVDDVSFSVGRGRTLGIVGESGCGKSVTSLAVMGLLATPPGRYAGGEILLEGRDLLTMSESERRALRGGQMGMIFQEPMTSLNPVYRIGDQIIESLRAHGMRDRRAARARAIELLDRVRLPSPEKRVDDYPHQLSGGQRQRVMIALALANSPALLIADEPTTALDVTIQAQILELIRELSTDTGAAIMMITHDLGVVAETCDDVMVMYAGRVVEQAPAAVLFAGPMHPYTLGLMAALPRLDRRSARLTTIPGAVPPPWAMPAGCRFAGRCPLASDICRTEMPPLRAMGQGQSVACWHAPIEELAA